MRPLHPYLVLLSLFTGGRIDADDFEAIFLPLYKYDPTLWSEADFGILDRLFGYVDDYCPDPVLRAKVGGLDGGSLLAHCGECLQELKANLAVLDFGS